MRSLSVLDVFISHVDNALKTLVPNAATAHRPNPAMEAEHAELNSQDAQHAAGLMRINHTGEVCAQALYQGQSLTARLPQVRDAMHEAAEEEVDHLVWCEQRLHELNSHTSVLNPVFYSLSYSIGALAGLAGDKWSLGFVAATEKQVCKHLVQHLQTLPAQDRRSRAILNVMLQDEQRHAALALESGGAAFPPWFQMGMTQLSKVMTNTTYRL